MVDFGELILIGAVALVVLGPERLPQTARTLGSWIGRLQNTVSQMRTEFDREFHLADLRSIGEEARAGARSVESAVRGAVGGVREQVGAARADALAGLGGNSWTGGPTSTAASFAKRYRPRPTIDDLTREVEHLQRRLALSPSASRVRGRYAPRSRVNRIRVRR